ncbi:catalase [Colletotrichum incanum]|uniref:Catalase n=1 Tax=Colletotrichum incanum TaxID=1573173 RepID=A0A167BE33_COLIC|nr:catalase [Colletotrichum incanum]OHX00009.1 putative catalase [Colletotrichum incanum]
MDDWQEAAFTSRHVHNRASKSKAGGGRGRRGGAFEVKRTFGRYDIKCPNASKTSSNSCGKNGSNVAPSTLDIFRLSDDGKGLLGYLVLPGTLEAKVVLTGSRKTLENLVSQFEDEEESEKDSAKKDDNDRTNDKGQDESVQSDASRNEDSMTSNDEDDSEDQQCQDKERRRFQNFEKNSFRSPKFWFQWKGQVKASSTTLDDQLFATNRVETGRGYIVFSGNDCRSFKGTITCGALSWKDVSLSGWKEVSMSERDVPFVWG